MNSDRSEKRSITESQKPPNREARFVASATFPSMKSKMLATSMTKPAVTNSPCAKNQAAMKLMKTPTRVSTLGWMRNATHARMMARRGNMQAAPMAPVNVMVGRCGAGREASPFGPARRPTDPAAGLPRARGAD